HQICAAGKGCSDCIYRFVQTKKAGRKHSLGLHRMERKLRFIYATAFTSPATNRSVFKVGRMPSRLNSCSTMPWTTGTASVGQTKQSWIVETNVSGYSAINHLTTRLNTKLDTVLCNRLATCR